MDWAVGLTTVPSRRGELLPHTLECLAAGGFPPPHLFVDGCDDSLDYADLTDRTNGLTCRFWPSPKNKNLRVHGVGVAANWLLSLGELYGADPFAERFALFQDDVLCLKNLRGYLDASWAQAASQSKTKEGKPAPFYLNLFTFMDNEVVRALGPGWQESTTRNPKHRMQTGRGALGLVFCREGVQTLLSCRELVNRYAERDKHSADGTARIDGAIVHVLNKAGFRELVHWPSLVQHAGKVSSMGNHRYPEAMSFPGTAADALDLLRDLPAPSGGGGSGEAMPTDVGPVLDRRLAAVEESQARLRRMLGKQ